VKDGLGTVDAPGSDRPLEDPGRRVSMHLEGGGLPQTQGARGSGGSARIWGHVKLML
jgi:hypothetical protein